MGAGVDVSAELLATLRDRGMIPHREPGHVSAVLTNSLVGYHGSLRYLGESPGRVPVGDYVATIVELVVT